MANIRAKQITKLNRLAGFRFVGATMRSLRFELSVATQEKEHVGSGFAHISFQTERATGFDTLRHILRSQQLSGRLRPAMLLAAVSDAPYLARAAIWRAFYKQLLWPAPAKYELHVVAEQLPHPENRITLSTEHDAFGVPRAAIEWRVREQDCRTFSVFRRYFDQFWNRHGLRSVGNLNWTYEPDARSLDEGSYGDVYHPGGCTRMGTNPRCAVVDANLRTFEIENLSIASTSVFPSGGGENPTLMLMLLTLKLADHLCTRVRIQ
jgi:choline dehydrogenase-like flavoprotein